MTDVFDEFIHYSTDTEPGSSGSPVLSDAWEVVALHHAGVPGPGGKGYVANEGIRISSIVAHLGALRESLPAAQQSVLRSLLDQTPGLPAPGGGEEAVTLERSAYAGLAGYVEDFLGDDYRIALPVPGETIRPDVAEVAGEEGGVLRYAHFSVVMNKARKLAFYTAVNIDGAQLKQLPRSGDRWYFDPRIDREVALSLDAGKATRAVADPPAHETGIFELFDEITYEKGGAVLRMFEAQIGEEVFRTGLRSYMAAHRYSNATADDLWYHLSQAAERDLTPA